MLPVKAYRFQRYHFCSMNSHGLSSFSGTTNARSAGIAATERELTRTELDKRVTQDSFWAIIAERFNDLSVHVALNLHGRLDNVDAGRPLHNLREAGRLRNAFIDTSGPFTLTKDRWSRSGQLCADNFADFVLRTDRGITTSGRREWIIFTAACLGTQHPYDRLLRLYTSTVPHVLADAVFDEGFSPKGVGLPSETGQEGSNY